MEMDGTLVDLGELRFLREFVLPLFGLDRQGPPADDAAVIELSGWPWDLVITTDPCPEPLANLVFAGETDPYFNIGWLTVVVNLSDIAAMGAQPVGIVVSSELPQSTPVRHAMRYFEGISSASTRFDCPMLGGNIRERDRVLSTGTALGKVRKGCALTQGGAQAGDLVAVIGHPGRFWAAILASRFGRDELGAVDMSWDGPQSNPTWTPQEVQSLRKAVLHPVPQVHTVPELVAYELVTAGVDASDGVGESLRKLAERTGLQVVLDEHLNVDPMVEKVGVANEIDPYNLLMSWGGWEMIIALPVNHLEKANRICGAAGEPLTVLGHLETGDAGAVIHRDGGGGYDVNLCGSERFTLDSYMTGGLPGYVDALRRPFHLTKGTGST
jgi:thiamine-monophosphate kinase